MNKVFLIGNLTRDPEKRKTQSGETVCNFSLAVSRRRAREGQPKADFFRVTVWGEQGENAAKYLAKGSKAAVAGEVNLESYTDREGLIRYQLAVQADSVEYLTPRQQGQADDGYTRTPDEELPAFDGGQ